MSCAVLIMFLCITCNSPMYNQLGRALVLLQNVLLPRGLGVNQASMASLIRSASVTVSQQHNFQAASHLPRGT